MKSSVHQIRQRLLLMLVRAFFAVMLLSVIFFLGVTTYFLTSSSTPIPLPFAGALEGYYLATGSWEGVETVFQANEHLVELKPTLLDAERRILIANRESLKDRIGEVYEIQERDVIVEIKDSQTTIGYLVMTTFSLSTRMGLARAVMLPVGIISIALVLFLVLVAALLMRRYVTPLADVIYAAEAVAGGKFDTRIAPTLANRDLHSLSERFNEMAASLERNDKERRAMLADIAHELRTPLSIIRGRLEGVVDGVYAETGAPVSTALEQTYLLERLVDDLRLLTLAESRQLHFELKPVHLGKLSQRVMDLFQAEAKEKDIFLALSYPPDLPAVPADPQRAEQVIANLISNALRYIPNGGRIWIEVNATKEAVRLTVNDNGAGVSPQDLPFLFERFWRKEKSRSRNTGGTGLGLAITKQLVEAQGGGIHAENLPAGGLRVSLHFPRPKD